MLKKLGTLLVCISVSLSAGAIGTIATVPNINTWYDVLEKPFFAPPNWLFGPVWTALYILLGIALYIVVTTKADHLKKDAYLIFGVQLLLNALWPFSFFGLRVPEVGVGIILLLLLSIVIMFMRFKPISNKSALLLVPYMLWVAYATLLNIAIAVLN